MSHQQQQQQQHRPRIVKRLSDFRSAPLPDIPTIRSVAPRRREAPDSDEYDTDLENERASAPPAKKSGGLEEIPEASPRDSSKATGKSKKWLARSAAVREMAEERRRRLEPVARGTRGGGDAPNPTALACTLLDISTIKDLNLADSRMGFGGAKEVVAALTVNESVTFVDFSNNALGGTGVSALLGKMLKTNSRLRALNLSNNDLHDEDMKYLSCGLEANLGLVELNLGHNCIGEEGAKYLAAALTANDVLRELNLSWNKVRKTGAISLGNAVKFNGSLEKLNLAWNGLAYEGTLSLRDMLQVNRQLSELDISNNRINWDGAGLLAEALQTNCHLTKLHVGDNPLTTTGALDIIKSVGSNAESALIVLDMKGIPVVRQFDAVCEEIQRSRPRFKAMHGGLVQLHDIIGERKVRRIHPMQKILEYMNQREMRPIELMRSFDKEGKCLLTADQFIQRLKSVGIELRVWEMEELKDYISAQGGQPGSFINYKKLIESITLQIEAERGHRIAERERQKRDKNKNDELLGRSHQTIVLDQSAVDHAVARLTGVKPAAAGSAADFALRVVSDSVTERRTKSFDAKMAQASNIKEANVNEQVLVQAAAGVGGRPAATADALSGRRLWMTAALDGVFVRSTYEVQHPPQPAAAAATRNALV